MWALFFLPLIIALRYEDAPFENHFQITVIVNDAGRSEDIAHTLEFALEFCGFEPYSITTHCTGASLRPYNAKYVETDLVTATHVYHNCLQPPIVQLWSSFNNPDPPIFHFLALPVLYGCRTLRPKSDFLQTNDHKAGDETPSALLGHVGDFLYFSTCVVF